MVVEQECVLTLETKRVMMTLVWQDNISNSPHNNDFDNTQDEESSAYTPCKRKVNGHNSLWRQMLIARDNWHGKTRSVLC